VENVGVDCGDAKNGCGDEQQHCEDGNYSPEMTENS
jgi:hypothetical protein